MLAALACAMTTVGVAIGAGSGGLSYRSESTPVADGAQDGTPVKCPAGTHVAGGGVYITGIDTDIEVATSAPFYNGPDEGWTGYANNDSGAPQTVTTHAICAKSGSYKYRSKSQPVPDGSQVAVTVRCPDGTRAAGGGVYIEGTYTGFEVATSAPFDGPDADTKPDDGWSGSANNVAGVGATAMSTDVICATSGKYRYRSDLKPVADGSQVGLSVGCPDGARAVAGGVAISGSGDTGISVATSAPSDGSDIDTKPDDGWTGYANNDSGMPQTMSTEAICKG